MIEKLTDRAGRALYLMHLLNLNREDRMLRFAGNMDGDVIVGYVNNIPDTDHLLGYRYDGELVGFAHIGYMGDGKAEIGFSVDAEARGKGIGERLFNYCVDFCKLKGVDTIYTFCLPTNAAVKRIVSKSGLSISKDEPGTALAIDQHPDVLAYYTVLGNEYMRNIYNVNRHFMRPLMFDR